jgi:hypothetical protein
VLHAATLLGLKAEVRFERAAWQRVFHQITAPATVPVCGN